MDIGSRTESRNITTEGRDWAEYTRRERRRVWITSSDSTVVTSSGLRWSDGKLGDDVVEVLLRAEAFRSSASQMARAHTFRRRGSSRDMLRRWLSCSLISLSVSTPAPLLRLEVLGRSFVWERITMLGPNESPLAAQDVHFWQDNILRYAFPTART